MNPGKYRKDFPILNKNIIYFDSACMSLKPQQVIDAMNSYYYEFPACAGRSMHSLARKAEEAVSTSRKDIAKFFNAKENEIIFTRNTTEGINLIANSLIEKNDKVLTSDKEHNSNLLPWQLKSKHEILFSNPDNTFNFEELNKKIKNTRLLSIVHTSNLDGVTNPIKEIIKIAHENDVLVLIDAAQSAPHQEINVKKLGIDFLACSGHKMLGPSGIGCLYGKEDLLKSLKPFMVGGETVIDSTYTAHTFEKIPNKFEAGLQNYSGIIGFGAAVNYLKKILPDIEEHEQKLNKILTENLNVNLIGPKDYKKRSGIFSFTANKDHHEIALMLDSFNIKIRSGAHCVHSWFNAHNMKGSARASLYFYNTEDECKTFVEKLNKILKL